MLIEKRLGINEEIIVHRKKIVAFESSVTISNDIIEKKAVNKYEYKCLKGPGLVIFEMSNQPIQNICLPKGTTLSFMKYFSIVIAMMLVNILITSI